MRGKKNMMSNTTAILLIACNLGLLFLTGYVLVQYNALQEQLNKHIELGEEARKNAREMINASQHMCHQAESINRIAKKIFANRQETEKAKQDVVDDLIKDILKQELASKDTVQN